MSGRLPKFLNDDDADALIAAGRNTYGERDRVMIACARYLGLRNAEVCRLRVERLDMSAGHVLVTGKGNKDRYIPISAKLLPMLREWLGGRRDGWVFPNERGQPWSPRTLHRIVARAGLDADIPRHVHPHMLRHSFATSLLSKGADIHDVKDLMGHSSLSVTEIYLHTLPGRLKNVVDRL